jgi:hypothetical protein
VIGALTQRAGLLLASVAIGLFVARILGDFIPDNLAATISMFGAGLAGGFLVGFATGARARAPSGAEVIAAARRIGGRDSK